MSRETIILLTFLLSCLIDELECYGGVARHLTQSRIERERGTGFLHLNAGGFLGGTTRYLSVDNFTFKYSINLYRFNLVSYSRIWSGC